MNSEGKYMLNLKEIRGCFGFGNVSQELLSLLSIHYKQDLIDKDFHNLEYFTCDESNGELTEVF